MSIILIDEEWTRKPTSVIKVIESGVKSAWQATETIGLDSTGRFKWTNNGAPTLSAKGVTFDAVDDFYNTANTYTAAEVKAQGITFLCKFTPQGSGGILCFAESAGHSGQSAGGIYFVDSPSYDELFFQTYDGDYKTVFNTSSDSDIAVGKPIEIAGIISVKNSRLELYVNKKLKYTTAITVSGLNFNASVGRIGRGFGASAGYFNGEIEYAYTVLSERHDLILNPHKIFSPKTTYTPKAAAGGVSLQKYAYHYMHNVGSNL